MRNKVSLTDDEVRALREKYAAGYRQVDLAAEYGVRQNTVSSLVTGRARESAGGPIRRASARKLTPEDVVAIRQAVADGVPIAELTARYPVSQQMLSNIVAGRAHTDVGGPLQGRPNSRATPLTVEQVQEILLRLGVGETRNALAAAFGISVWTIDSVARGATTGVSKADREHTRAEVVKMRALNKQGASQVELARMFGTSQARVSQIVRGYTHRAHGGPIAGAQSRRLSSDQVLRIREAFAAKASLGELADRYGTSKSIIKLVVTGASYANAPGPTFKLDRAGRMVNPE